MSENYIIGEPIYHHYHRDHYWIRFDEYVPNGTYQRVKIAHQQDFSPIYSGYNGNCSCCYLGICHSEQVHKESINEILQTTRSG